MSIQQQVFLRYRGAGHIRFTLPAVLCQPETAERLIAGLRQAPGIYQVDLYRRQRKLSIRYAEGNGNFKAVTDAMHELLAQIESAPAATTHASSDLTAGVSAATAHPTSNGWLRRSYEKLKETVAAARTGIRNQPKHSPVGTLIDKQFALEFLTDVLVLYLIKTHWHIITQHWLKRPWQYRSEWLAALYMIFLLVRSKRPKS